MTEERSRVGNSYYDSEEFTKKTADKLNKHYVKSGLSFLNAHLGLRPGQIHTLLASRGAGKSTLVRGVVNDILMNNGSLRIGLWLSEEKSETFWEDLNQSREYRRNEFIIERLVVKSENDIKISGNKRDMRFIFDQFISDPWLDVVIIDNITTSDMYNNRNNVEQSSFIDDLKVTCEKRDIPFFLVAHTNAPTSDSSLSFPVLEDIRGDKSIINYGQTFYVLTSMLIGGERYGVIKLDKCRSKTVEHGIFFCEFNDKYRMIIRTYGIKNLEFEDLVKQEKERRARKPEGETVNVPLTRKY